MQKNAAIDIIIPFRNEAMNLPGLMDSLGVVEVQPNDRCILVDDASNDNGAQLIKETAFFKLIQLSSQQSRGKKDALQAGIEAGTKPFILTTDADCMFQPEWMETMRQAIHDNTRLLIGPVLVRRESGFIAWLQEQEAMVLLAITRYTALKKQAILCSGANLLFSRVAFKEAGGYQAHIEKSSGDDVLLLRTFFAIGSGGITFVDEPNACVFTRPVRTWRQWFGQRFRWAGKTAHLHSPLRKLISAWLVVQLFLPWILIFVFWPLAVLIPFFEYPWLLKVAIRYRRRFFIGDWFFFRFIYPLPVLLLFLLMPFAKPKWKGRMVR